MADNHLSSNFAGQCQGEDEFSFGSTASMTEAANHRNIAAAFFNHQQHQRITSPTPPVENIYQQSTSSRAFQENDSWISHRHGQRDTQALKLISMENSHRQGGNLRRCVANAVDKQISNRSAHDIAFFTMISLLRRAEQLRERNSIIEEPDRHRCIIGKSNANNWHLQIAVARASAEAPAAGNTKR